jgi:hypothetical protein
VLACAGQPACAEVLAYEVRVPLACVVLRRRRHRHRLLHEELHRLRHRHRHDQLKQPSGIDTAIKQETLKSFSWNT